MGKIMITGGASCNEIFLVDGLTDNGHDASVPINLSSCLKNQINVEATFNLLEDNRNTITFLMIN